MAHKDCILQRRWHVGLNLGEVILVWHALEEARCGILALANLLFHYRLLTRYAHPRRSRHASSHHAPRYRPVTVAC